MKQKISLNIWFFFFLVFLLGCKKTEDFTIYLSESAEEKEWLAAKELRRYLYLRIDKLIPIIKGPIPDTSPSNGIMIGTRKNQELIKFLPDSIQTSIPNLTSEAYILYTNNANGNSSSIILGADFQGLLFGTYRFLEKLGVCFYLHGDVIPDEKITLNLPSFLEIRQPLFNIRGILPFHDFPEGPDWWDEEDYNLFITQLPKLQMNFIGFHTYPESDFLGAYKAEPLVWIGEEKNIMEDGKVTSAYPLLHFNTVDTTWGYMPLQTSHYSGGATQLFEKDRFGATYLPTLSTWPHTEQGNIQLVNNFGKVLNECFTLANRLGVNTCIGTETPLTIPELVYKQLQQKYPQASQDSLIRLLYGGMFQRIKKTHPLDYYWFWTPENWTWSEVSDIDVDNTKKDLQIAVEVADNLQVPFTLATCGWVLGPPRNRAEFDDVLPKTMPFSCINRYVGFARIEPAFNQISERPLWAIPWLEDDPALLSPQLWAGRMRKDAYDAFKYGCNGLVGIHWRTRLIGPTLAALAKAGWDLISWNQTNTNNRDIPVDDFYEDWAIHQFGKNKGKEIGNLFASLDGGPEYIPEYNKPYEANLFRTSHWDRGPGAIIVIQEPWSEISKRFSFVEKMENFRQDISGEGNLERFDYWLNTFQFARETARMGCLLGEMEKSAQLLNSSNDISRTDSIVRNHLLPLRIQATQTYSQMMQYLLMTVTNSSEMGTIANLEQHNLLTLKKLNKYDSLLESILKESLPASTIPQKNYEGPSKLILQAPVSILEKNSDLYLKVRALSPFQIDKVKLYWKELGSSSYQTADFININRNVFDVALDKHNINNQDLEYYVEAILENGEKIHYPATAGKINQTVVVF